MAITAVVLKRVDPCLTAEPLQIIAPTTVVNPGENLQLEVQGGIEPYQWLTSRGVIDNNGYLAVPNEECSIVITVIDACGNKILK